MRRCEASGEARRGEARLGAAWLHPPRTRGEVAGGKAVTVAARVSKRVQELSWTVLVEPIVLIGRRAKAQRRDAAIRVTAVSVTTSLVCDQSHDQVLLRTKGGGERVEREGMSRR